MCNDDVNYSEYWNQLDAQEEERRRLLGRLLDDQRDRAHHFLAIKAKMGKTPSYIISATLDWVANKVNYASELPIFKNIADEKTRKIPVNSDTLLLRQQRDLDWRRQFELTSYLIRKESRKFPPMLVAASKNWVYDQESDKWVHSKATQNSIEANSLDSKKQYFDLIIDESTILYTVDGQHRLMAIKGLIQELLSNHILHALDNRRIPKSKKEPLTIQSVIESDGINETDLQDMRKERIGIEIIPAVLQGETYIEACRRLRTIFVDTNKYAKPPTKGDNHLLDEENGFVIVARDTMVDPELHLFKQSANVQLTGNQLRDNSKHYTTLDALVEISKHYLGQLEPFLHLDIDFRPVRSELEAMSEELKSYFVNLSRLPSHLAFIDGEPAEKIRTREKEGRDHILFRPVAQIALADAVGYLIAKNKYTHNKIFDILSQKDEEGHLKLTDLCNPWCGVICDIGKLHAHNNLKMLTKVKDRKLCSYLFRHLLGGGTEDDIKKENLKQLFTQARKIDEDHAIDLNGENVPEKDIKLPNPWSW